MIICICRRVSDRELVQHARCGKSFDDIQFDTGVSSQCGQCESAARQVVERGCTVAEQQVCASQHEHRGSRIQWQPSMLGATA